MMVCHYPWGAALPEPWEPDWQCGIIVDLSPTPRRGVARAPAGTPLPPGCTAYVRPEPDEALAARAAKLFLGSFSAMPDGRYEAEAWLGVAHPYPMPDGRYEAEAWLGVAHPYVHWAPLGWSRDQAAHAMVVANDEWTSRCSEAVVRCAESGYRVWAGIGSMMVDAGRVDTIDDAERLACRAVMQQRREAMVVIRRRLEGWPDETPYYSATIGTAVDQLPWTLSRGPLTAAELPGKYGPSTSWDLPVVARFAGGSVERWPERVTWDDEASRGAKRERERRGEQRRRAEIQAALELLRSSPLVGHLVLQSGLDRAEIESRGIGGGAPVRTVGPVRMRHDGQVALALVEQGRRRFWMAV